MTENACTCTFSPDSMTINRKEYPAEYSVTPSGTVFVFTSVKDGEQVRKVRIRIDADNPHYAALLASSVA